MCSLQEIDNLVSKFKSDVAEFSKTLNFENGLCFNPGDNESFDKIPKSHGVYLFSINNTCSLPFVDWLSWFQPIWENGEYKKKFTPNTSKKNIEIHKENNYTSDWIPLYLGKSKNIYSRIKQHKELDLNTPTFAMKLDARKNLQNIIFKVEFIEINTNNPNEVLVLIEKELRNKFNPIIGRQ